MMIRYSHFSQKGVTLIELMIVIALLAILTTIAAPSYNNLIQRNSVDGGVDLFVAQLRLARNEAVRRNNTVTLGKSDSSTNWVDGTRVYQDTARDGSVYVASTHALIRQQSEFDNIVITSSLSPDSANTISFHPDGYVANIGTNWFCLKNNGQIRKITIENSGLIIITTPSSCT